MEEIKLSQSLQDELKRVKAELQETAFRLEEANDTLNAIRSGEVDALIVKKADSHQIFTLKTADHAFRIFIEQVTEGVITLHKDGHILYCNSSFAMLVGEPLEKIIGQAFCKFIPQQYQDYCNMLLKKAWVDNSRGELNLLSSSAREIPVLLSCKRLDLEEDISLSIILTNLSEQKEQQQQLISKNQLLEEAEKTARYLNTNLETLVGERTSELRKTIEEKTNLSEQLRNNQERLSQVLETMAEGVIILNPAGTITYANRMAQQILGLQQMAGTAEVKYETAFQPVTIDGIPLQRHELPAYISLVTGKPVYDQEIGLDPPGRDRIYVSFNAVPILDGYDNVTGAIGTFMDVTRRRIAIQQKDDFIGVASHELKTPITTLKGSIQLLDRFKTEPGNSMVPKLIEQANKGMKKLTYLVEDLLDVTRIKEGQLHLNKETFTLRRLLDDAIEHLDKQNLQRINITGDTGINIVADAGRLEQVLVNFINNAIKYAAGSPVIEIRIEKSTGAIKILVKDQGPGIATDKQAHLFDRYFRTDYSGAQYSGLGLGLYISSEIIKKHGGEIGVDSELGKGSTFWFSIPLQPVE